MNTLLYVIIGFVSGIISGMGIGGGAILIPALSIIFGIGQHEAQNINLIYFLPTASVALITHIKKGSIEKKSLLQVIIFGLAGAAAGSFIALRIDASLLRRMFGFFLLAMGAVEIFKKKKEDQHG